MPSLSRIAAAAACAAAVFPAAAHAAPALTGVFPTTDMPGEIATGPDGDAWFLLPGNAAGPELNHVAADGTITGFDLPGDATGTGLVSGPDVAGGPDNRLWVARDGGVIKVDPANPAGAQDFPIPDITAGARTIAPDRDGNLWVADGDGLVKVAPDGTELKDLPVPGASPRDITLGGDGRMWWTDFANMAVQATETADPFTTTAVAPDLGFGLQGIEAGPGTQVAYGRPGTELGLLAPGVAPLKITDNADPGFGIAFAGDGAYWVTRFAQNGLGRLTPQGAYTTPIAFPAGSGPRHIARGSDNTLWVTLEQSKQIARVSGVTAPPATGGGGGSTTGGGSAVPDRTKPRLSGLTVNARTRKLVLRASERVTLRIAVERRASGKRVGKRCKATSKKPHAKRCTRYVKARSLKATVPAGRATVSLGGTLRAGTYRVSVTGADAAGNTSAVARRGFTVPKPKRRSKR